MTQSEAVKANHELAAQLRESRLKPGIKHFIGGQWVDSASGETFDTHSPVDNTFLVKTAKGDAQDIDRAAKAAWEAFPTWREVGGAERRKIMHKIADLIEKRSQEIALLESMDTGQAIRFMKSAATRGAENFRFYADRAPAAQDGQSLPTTGFINYSIRQPIGPVGVITPWNTPFMLSTWKIAPALAAGCTVVHKPAEWSPVSATLLAEIMDEAGLPKVSTTSFTGSGKVRARASPSTRLSRPWPSWARPPRAATSCGRVRTPLSAFTSSWAARIPSSCSTTLTSTRRWTPWCS